MDDDSRMRQLRIASQQYVYAVSKLPYPGAFASFHRNFAELVQHNFHINQKPWLNPFEAAALANYIALFGSPSHKQKPLPEISAALNKLKALWKSAEEESDYSDDPAHAATFALRLAYQQIPFSVHPLRVARVLTLVRDLFSAPDLEEYIQNRLGLTNHDLMAVIVLLLNRFSSWSRSTENELLGLADHEHIRIVLGLLAADRTQRLAFFRGKLKVKSPVEMPYELNTLLRHPLVKCENYYYAPYPELIGYAATRGLFFRFAEEHGKSFREPFVRSFEAKTATILAAMLPGAEILTEQQERGLGWKGKTNDVTAVWEDCALLVECKLSGLYVEAKRTASLDAVVADTRKQIADGRDRRGLFQLHDKIAAIRAKELPARLQEKYKNVKRFFPVLLLFDEISFANTPETLGNIIKVELEAQGVKDFDYQIWHLEELSWLAEFGGDASALWVSEKFSQENKAVGLNSFISERAGKAFLNPPMYMPQGDTRARRVFLQLGAESIS